jgi:hypothetical protein
MTCNFSSTLHIIKGKKALLNKKGKAIPVHALRAYRGSSGVILLNLNLDNRRK